MPKVDETDRTDPRRVAGSLRAVIAGSRAARLIASSTVLFEAGGKRVLGDGTKAALRGAAERAAEGALALTAGPLLGPAAAVARRPSAMASKTVAAARVAGPVAARAAGKEILKGAGKAAGIGFAIDGAFASVEAVVAVRNGDMDRRSAASYVAKEAATGAIATGTGVLLGAGLVVLTGGTAAPIVFAVGALGSIGTKKALARLTRTRREVRVREMGAGPAAIHTD